MKVPETQITAPCGTSDSILELLIGHRFNVSGLASDDNSG